MQDFTIETLTTIMTKHCNLPEGNYSLRDCKLTLGAFLALDTLDQQKVVNATNEKIADIVSNAFSLATKDVIENVDLS